MKDDLYYKFNIQLYKSIIMNYVNVQHLNQLFISVNIKHQPKFKTRAIFRPDTRF